MTYVEIFLLAFALSVDACIVSFSYGLAFSQKCLKTALMLALFTGSFQGIMPVVGYYLTSIVKSFIAPFAEIIVFTIFLFLGVKFIKEAFEVNKSKPNCIGFLCLFLIGIATSIDAFSAGISLALYSNHILKPAMLITLITFINSLLGFYIGGKLKHLPTKSLEIFAGVILIFLGIKALV